MALKTDFEDSNDLASPFVDEVANPGVYGSASKARDRGRKARKKKRKSDAADRKRRRKQGF